MAENLLWPAKLSMPPQLLINPQALFDGEKLPDIPVPPVAPFSSRQNGSSEQKSLVPIEGSAKVRYIDSVLGSFTIGFVANIEAPDTSLRTQLRLPFQDLSTEILQYKMRLWNTGGDPNILSTPDQTELKTNLNVSARTSIIQTDDYPLRVQLFKMLGESLENNGYKPQFESNRGYSILTYDVPKGFKENLELEFPDMFNEYNHDPNICTLAIETVVKVNVVSATDPNGFKVGVMPF